MQAESIITELPKYATSIVTILIAIMTYYILPKFQRLSQNTKRFYDIKSDISRDMEKINEIRIRSDYQIKYITDIYQSHRKNESKNIHENIMNINFELSKKYDLQRVYTLFLDLREKYFEERAELKDKYNDLLALIIEMNDDEMFYRPYKMRNIFRSKKDKRLIQRVKETYFSSLNFLTSIGFEESLLMTERIKELNIGPCHRAEDLPKAIPITKGFNAFNYGIWLPDEIYDFANKVTSIYEKSSLKAS